MRRAKTALCALIAGLGCAAPAVSQDTPEAEDRAQPPREVTLGQPAATDPLTPDSDERGAIDPTGNAGSPDHRAEIPATRIVVDPRVLGVAPGDPLPPLRREGEFLRNRTGHLLPADDRGYAVFVMDPDEAAGEDRPVAMILAPNRALESLEKLVEQRGEEVGFTISGQVHTYRGVNYLLITAPPKPWTQTPDEADAQAEPETGEDDDNPAPPPAVDTESPDPSTPDDGVPLTPEEELQELLRQRGQPGANNPSNPQRSPNAAPSASPQGDRGSIAMPDIPRGGAAVDPAVMGIAPGQPQAELVSEGTIVVRRAGRLVRSGDGSHAIFVFDSDGRENPEPPMIVQACKLLEEMEAILYTQGGHVPFVVTGQVQTFRGANYLLPTIMRQEFDRGNLE